jgi:hypothetical protein
MITSDREHTARIPNTAGQILLIRVFPDRPRNLKDQFLAADLGPRQFPQPGHYSPEGFRDLFCH